MAKKKKGKKQNPRNQPRTQEDVNRAWDVGCIDGIRLMEAITLRVLIDKHEGDIDIPRFWTELTEQTAAWAEGRLTAADIRNSLKEEDKIMLASGPSSAIAHDRRAE